MATSYAWLVYKNVALSETEFLESRTVFSLSLSLCPKLWTAAIVDKPNVPIRYRRMCWRSGLVAHQAELLQVNLKVNN